MNGLDKITERIAADARLQAEQTLKEAKLQCEAIAADAQAQSERECAEIVARGELQAREREKRIASMAQLEGRKRMLGVKQVCIGLAFDRALKQLLKTPQGEYTELLARMAANASVTGREKVILSAKDRKKIGKQVVAKANEILMQRIAPKVAPKVPERFKGSALDKAVQAGSARLAGTGMLTLSDETRDIPGGFILSNEGVELNCAFDTLVRLARPELERQVAEILFAS